MKKLQLFEEKSISKDIEKLAKELEDIIIEDMNTIEAVFYSPTIQLPFKSNRFRINFDDDFPFISDIILYYTIYLAQNQEEYVKAIKYYESELNSSYDEDTRTLKIVSCAIGGKLEKGFGESIIHELTHMYQYAKGMNKKVSLYDKMLELQRKGRTDINAYYVGLALYYTFPHEQDAFAHQFYVSQNEDYTSFEPYIYFKRALSVVKNNYKSKEMKNAIEYLGFEPKTFLIRLHYGFKRFVKKLNNVTLLLKQESNTMKESIKEMCVFLNENKNNLILGCEEFFNFRESRVIKIIKEEIDNYLMKNIQIKKIG